MRRVRGRLFSGVFLSLLRRRRRRLGDCAKLRRFATLRGVLLGTFRFRLARLFERLEFLPEARDARLGLGQAGAKRGGFSLRRFASRAGFLRRFLRLGAAFLTVAFATLEILALASERLLGERARGLRGLERPRRLLSLETNVGQGRRARVRGGLLRRRERLGVRLLRRRERVRGGLLRRRERLGVRLLRHGVRFVRLGVRGANGSELGANGLELGAGGVQLRDELDGGFFREDSILRGRRSVAGRRRLELRGQSGDARHRRLARRFRVLRRRFRLGDATTERRDFVRGGVARAVVATSRRVGGSESLGEPRAEVFHLAARLFRGEFILGDVGGESTDDAVLRGERAARVGGGGVHGLCARGERQLFRLAPGAEEDVADGAGDGGGEIHAAPPVLIAVFHRGDDAGGGEILLLGLERAHVAKGEEHLDGLARDQAHEGGHGGVVVGEVLVEDVQRACADERGGTQVAHDHLVLRGERGGEARVRVIVSVRSGSWTRRRVRRTEGTRRAGGETRRAPASRTWAG